MVSSDQVQQLIRTNEALLKTNASLKEMVISVTELLRNPARHVTYAEPLSGSILGADDDLSEKGSRSFQCEDRGHRSLPPSRRTTQDPEGEHDMVSIVDHITPMTWQEIAEEDALYRRKYQGQRFPVVLA